MKARGFDWSKLTIETSLAECVDLREVFKKGSFIVDGVLNQDWQKGSDRFCNGADGEKGPAGNENAWRHAVPVMDGVVHETGVDHIDVKWLWLGDDGVSPALNRGYMRQICKVYQVTRRPLLDAISRLEVAGAHSSALLVALQPCSPRLVAITSPYCSLSADVTISDGAAAGTAPIQMPAEVSFASQSFSILHYSIH